MVVIKLLPAFVFFLLIQSCQAQPQSNFRDEGSNQVVGGAFENRDFMFIDMPEHIASVDTSPGWSEDGPKIMISGTILNQDGKTPASDVVLYYYHTDVHGIYAEKEGLNPKVKRHGYIRGWVKSDEEGRYTIYTIRPASYPNTSITAHIHLTIKEADISVPYWIDAWLFDDDPLLTDDERKSMRNRGGNGILKLHRENDLWVANHEIILGLNIPNYPEE